jgi:hypothetical protein
VTFEAFLDIKEIQPVAPESGGDFRGRCPLHGDGRGHLSIFCNPDKIGLHCHAGCETKDILDALGLRWRDLWYDQSATTRQARKEYWEQPEAEYHYYDEDGDLLYTVVRFPGKRFRQIRKRVPYRLPELLDGIARGERIYIVEGEKDVHALVDAGEVATCNANGADEWQPEWDDYFKGANIVIVQDRDDAGREHARSVASMLYEAANSIEIREAAIGKDAADHLSDPWMTPDTLRLVRRVKP